MFTERFLLKFIIFDLEFNSGKNRKTGLAINEIIEIGAVMLDDGLNEIGSFSKTVRPALTMYLNKHVKQLCSITDKELKNAAGFDEVIGDFINWCGGDCIFSSWSNTDLYVMLENLIAYKGLNDIPFIKNYFDMQKFVTRVIERTDNNQVSLKFACENFSINTDNFSLHRAEDDSRVCSELFRKTYDKRALKSYLVDTSEPEYYARMAFKPFFITELEKYEIPRRTFFAACPYCRRRMRRISKTSQKFSVFHTKMRCMICKRSFDLQVKIKKTYDGFDIKKKLREQVFTDKSQNGAENDAVGKE